MKNYDLKKKKENYKQIHNKNMRQIIMSNRNCALMI